MTDHVDIMTPNAGRIRAAIYHSLLAAERRRRLPLTQYDLVKTLFLADRSHLNEWGRPITYDNYKAMEHGPVPSLAYDFLKGNERAVREHGFGSLPWTWTQGKKGKKFYTPRRGAIDVEEWLSESDTEALDDALTTVLRLGFGQVRRLTHEDPAYVDAWREDGGRAAYDMKLGLLFDEPNFDRAQLLAEQSAYV
ncbi:Panacea domain-containing protein [Citreimonas salinaria]|uniref:Uncharacterized phage-associated protein n=1 Tax=Citreimonas salinaria TaxID=321339 RepID=A0A1H3HU81_9RHOB|nr:Panacea domain-containing protein [Citreimonas salinaria]SDY18348.1 Uncharacterized phage-associated protein [Citreimonas salinaria]